MRKEKNNTNKFWLTFFISTMCLVAALIISLAVSSNLQWFDPNSSVFSVSAMLATAIFGAVTVALLLRRDKADRVAHEQSIATFRNSQAADRANRFEKGVALLGSQKDSVKAGGVQLLRGVAEEAADYHESVSGLLAAFIQEECSETFTFLTGRIFTAFDEREGFLEGYAGLETPSAAIEALNALGRLGSLQEFSKSGMKDGNRGLILDRIFLSSRVPLTGVFSGIHFRDLIVGKAMFVKSDFANTAVQATILEQLSFVDVGARRSSFHFSETPRSIRGKIEFKNSDMSHAEVVAAVPSMVAIHNSQIDGLRMLAPDSQIAQSWYQRARPQLLGVANADAFYSPLHRRPSGKTPRGFSLHTRQRKPRGLLEGSHSTSVLLRPQQSGASVGPLWNTNSSFIPPQGPKEAHPAGIEESLYVRVARFCEDGAVPIPDEK